MCTCGATSFGCHHDENIGSDDGATCLVGHRFRWWYHRFRWWGHMFGWFSVSFDGGPHVLMAEPQV